MRLYKREWRVGLVLTFSTLMGAFFTDAYGRRIVFSILAVAAAILTLLAFREDRRARKPSEPL